MFNEDRASQLDDESSNNNEGNSYYTYSSTRPSCAIVYHLIKIVLEKQYTKTLHSYHQYCDSHKTGVGLFCHWHAHYCDTDTLFCCKEVSLSHDPFHLV